MRFTRSFAVLLATVAVLAAQTPSNNNCAGAIAVFNGINPTPPNGSAAVYTNVNATNSTAFPTETACGDDVAIMDHVFSSYVATDTTNVVI
jgi:hypothetical protein